MLLRKDERPPLTRRRIVLRRVASATAAALVLLAAWVVVPALTADSNDSLAARLAESARDRGLGFAVTGLERLQYSLHPPRSGGTVDAADASSLAADAAPTATGRPAAGEASAEPRHGGTSGPPPVALHPPLAPLVPQPLPGEGDFTTKVVVAGQPAVQTARLRPDDVHTSYLAGVAWMSSRLLRFEQHPGSEDPGGLSRWSTAATIPPSRRQGLAATFNSGFKIADSQGGFYQDGHTVGALKQGSASFVVYADGHADVGAWGSDVRMSSQVRSVRQNLQLLVDGGRLSPDVDSDTQVSWGATIGARAYVWRSGVGVTSDGDVVFAAGDALSAHTLGALLLRAGAVRAMELDINPEWISFMWYTPSPSGDPVPHKLGDFVRPADRYYSVNSRDFFAVYAR